MFRTYKPKGEKVKAVQVTAENAATIAETFMGRVKDTIEGGISIGVQGVDIPTFEGTKNIPIGDWLVRSDGSSVTVMTNKDFEQHYEVARATGATTS